LDEPLTHSLTPTVTEEHSPLAPISLIQTVKLAWMDRKMFFMIPIIFYNGMSLGFMLGDYSASVATRGLGVNYAGFVIASFYLSNSIFTVLFGKLAATWVGRRGLTWIATASHILFFVFFLIWTVPENFSEALVDNKNQETQNDSPDIYCYTWVFLGTIVFALGDAVWESQPPAILQTYYDSLIAVNCAGCGKQYQLPVATSVYDCPKCHRLIEGKELQLDPSAVEAAMANLKMWQSLGFAVEFLIGVFVSDITIKLIVLVSLQVLSFLILIYLDRFVAKFDREKVQISEHLLNT